MIERKVESLTELSQHQFKIPSKKSPTLIKLFLLWRSHQFLSTYFTQKFLPHNYFKFEHEVELYIMDSKIFCLLIEEIIETGDYTLEGIAHYARMPVELFEDILCRKNSSPSITLWSIVISLYVQVKPEFAKYLFNTLSSEQDVSNNLVMVS